ncbi:hypothetical protein NMYAN_130043 [Nitrosomonas nitrosa]|uniref:Uncharacterized protein n=1 Tax=Nitrosomonas nitrosa TaxID=52442 RepID=A0A8H8YYC9_9PROT|nr:hypothetical protein NMYAN_130043 [Nitrosomonas nitrosa]
MMGNTLLSPFFFSLGTHSHPSRAHLTDSPTHSPCVNNKATFALKLRNRKSIFKFKTNVSLISDNTL